MSQSITPYRASSEIEKYPETRPSFGLIRAKAPHQCSPPGALKRFGFWLIGKPILKNSLFRCKCGEVWKLCKRYGEPFGWCSVELSDWTKGGGYHD